MPAIAPPLQRIFELRVNLRDVEPEVWRRVLIPGSVRLDKLHIMLQAAMGWTNSHLHAFTIGAARYGTAFDELAATELDEKMATVIGALRDIEHFEYEYDFGDSWIHDVVIEARHSTARGLKHAVCLAGANACPPEDCGGPGGYHELLAALAGASSKDRRELVEWIDGSFSATFFDVADANVRLQSVRMRQQARET